MTPRPRPNGRVSTIVGDYDDKAGTYPLIATVTDNLSIKEYWAEARFTGLQIEGLTLVAH